MFENTTSKTTRRLRRFGPAAGISLLLLAGAACGGQSQSSSGGQGATAAPASRTNPTSEEVAVVITQVEKRIPMSFLPTEAHVRAFGDAACSAFDQGKSEPQVRDLVMQAASQLPSGTISNADADFAVGTAVKLFCPGYTSKLGS